MSCDQCIKKSRINRSLTRHHLQNPNEHITAPVDAMQSDSVPELPPTSHQDDKIFARVIINIMTKHAHLTTTLISDKAQPLCLT